MDLLQEDNVQEDNNPNPVHSEDNKKKKEDEQTSSSCIENQNNNSNPESSCLGNNNKLDVETVSSLITDENNPPQKSEDNPENNNVMEFISESGKTEEEGEKLSGEVLVDLMETEEKKQEKNSSSVGDKERPKPLGFSSSSLDGLVKYCSDDESVDSSSDSSSSSSSSEDDESSSDEDDEMNEEKGDDDDDNNQVGLPKKVVFPQPPPPEEKTEEKKEESLENGKSTTNKILNFPSYRDNDEESSDDTSSDSSSSSSSETEENEADHAQRQRPNRPPREKDSDGEERTSRPRVRGEIFPEELPALENLDINIDDNVDLKMLGKITSVIKNIAVAHAEFSSPIDQDSMIFLEDRTCIGKVHDIIGPVREPFYTIILDKKHTAIPLDTEIYCAPEEKEYTNYVFVNDLKNLKGSDASWEHDIEPPAKFLDYSDDEHERSVKKRNKCKNSANANGDSNDDPNDKNGKSRNRNRPGSSSTGTSNTRNWRKRDSNRGSNSKATDAALKSMFACSAQWPPSNEQARSTSWPPPTPPQYPQPNHPTYQEEYNRLNQMMWPQNNSQPNSPGVMRAPFRPPWNYPQRQPNMGPYPAHFNYPQSGNSFNPVPPNQPWFQGPIHGSQGPPYGTQGQQNPQGPPYRTQGQQSPQGPYGFMRNPPPRFSQPPQFPGMYP